MQTSWTRPETPAQVAYFAKKGRLLYKYRSTIKWLSYVWMLFAFFGIELGIAHALQTFSLPGWVPGLMAFAFLWFIHPYLIEDTETFFFDKLDDDPETNKSWIMPALFILVVFLADRWGMAHLGEKYGYKAKPESTTAPDSLLNAVNMIDLAAYEKEKDDIEALYKDKERSTALPYTAIINDLKRREKADNKRYTSKIAEQKALKEAALAKVAAERTIRLEDARKDYEEWLAFNKTAHARNTENVLAHNGKEAAKQSASEAMSQWGSWVIAVFFVLAFVGLNWRMADMGVKCGVRPVHQYTPLDKYGGVWGWFKSTMIDIYRRQAVRLASHIHEVGTRGTADLSDLDTQVRFGQKEYNNPDPHQPSPPENIKPINGNSHSGMGKASPQMN